MISRIKLLNRIKLLYVLLNLMMLLNVNATNADTHLSVQVSDPLVFNDYFNMGDDFGGLLSDFIELTDGTHDIKVFGPSGKPPYLFEGMFYGLTIGVKVLKSVPKVQSVSFYSACTGERDKFVKEWPTPLIIKDKSFQSAYRLVINSPILAERETPCPPQTTLMLPSTNIGELKLITSSTPAGSEVWIGGVLIGKTNSTIKVPYRGENINVVIRMPGYVNCKWSLKVPFKKNARLHCLRKTP